MQQWTVHGWKNACTKYDTGVFSYPLASGMEVLPLGGSLVRVIPEVPVFVLLTCQEWMDDGHVGELYRLLPGVVGVEAVCQALWLAPPRYKSGKHKNLFRAKHEEASPPEVTAGEGYSLDPQTLFVVSGFCKLTTSSGNVSFDQAAFKDAWRKCWSESELDGSSFTQVTLMQGSEELTVLSLVDDEDFDPPVALDLSCVAESALPRSMNSRTESQLALELVSALQAQDPLAMVYFSPVAMRGAVRVNRLLFNGALSAPRLTVGLEQSVEEAVQLLQARHAEAVVKALTRGRQEEEEADLIQEEDEAELGVSETTEGEDRKAEMNQWRSLQDGASDAPARGPSDMNQQHMSTTQG